MAVGDRVIIGDGTTWNSSVTVRCYEPIVDSAGNLDLDTYGAAKIIKLGGVKGGTTGVMLGQPVRIHRLQLVGEENIPNIGGIDFVNLFPVQFDYYQRVGWVPSHHIKIFEGGLPLP